MWLQLTVRFTLRKRVGRGYEGVGMQGKAVGGTRRQLDGTKQWNVFTLPSAYPWHALLALTAKMTVG